MFKKNIDVAERRTSMPIDVITDGIQGTVSESHETSSHKTSQSFEGGSSTFGLSQSVGNLAVV